MRQRVRSILAGAAALLVAAACGATIHNQGTGAGNERVVEIAVKKFEYIPPEITLKKGEPVRARVWLDERKQALADRVRRIGREALLARADELGRQALGADLLGHLAQRHLAQRRQVLDLEEVVERRVDAL